MPAELAAAGRQVSSNADAGFSCHIRYSFATSPSGVDRVNHKHALRNSSQLSTSETSECSDVGHTT